MFFFDFRLIRRFVGKKIQNPSIAVQLCTALKIYRQIQQTNEKEFNDRRLDANY